MENTLARALNSLGNYKEAIKYFDKALAIDPEYKWAPHNKALALNRLGNSTGSLAYLKNMH